MSRFTTLYSGSSGNAGVVEENGKFILVDMGASCKATLKALEQVGLSPSNLIGILITHEHSDHIKGLNVFLKKHPVPIYSGEETIDALLKMGAVPLGTEMVMVDGKEHDIGGFKVIGFATSHDAAGSCGFTVVTPSGAIMAIATDLGMVTDGVMSQLEKAQLVALEANYDYASLFGGGYPQFLKKRIASGRGHLCNNECAGAVAKLVKKGCKKIALCHLSEENNQPSLVKQAIEEALFANGIKMPKDCVLQVSKRREPSLWMEF